MEEKLRFTWKGSLLQFLFLVLITECNSTESDVIVSLAHGGKVQGSTMISTEGRTFYAFRGIPYAEPPLGDLRFKLPVPKKGWTDEILDASKDGPSCTQNDMFTKRGLIGDEDCLTLNVYTEKLAADDKVVDEDKAAVMVFIHGGGFMGGGGSSVIYGPAHLMDTGVVLVTLNYRLDAFGFLSTGDQASPGNYGLWDQLLALRWVQENIELFGGNKDRVTLFGQSAGGASVSHHLLSPLSKGLFHGAIQMSGAATCSWAINEDAPYWSQRLAKDVGCPDKDNLQLVECLRKTPAEDIIKHTTTYMRMACFPLPFSPTVDGHFIPDHPRKMLLSHDNLNPVPVISGLDEEEGAFVLGIILLAHKDKSVTSEKFVTDIIEDVFGGPKPLSEVTDMIKEAYFASVDFKNERQMEATIIDAFSEGLDEMCLYETINGFAQAGWRTYAYSYDYVSNFNFSEALGVKKHWGVTHCDELPMLFSNSVPGFKMEFSEKDRVMKRKILTLWTNFAKYGTPVPLKQQRSFLKWPRIEDNGIPVYHINEQIELKTYDLANNKKYHFWTKEIRNAMAKKNGYSQKEEL